MSLPATGGSLQPLEDHNPPERRFPAGFALVLVLCVLAVLSVIAVTLIRETREETRFEGAVIEDAKAEALAEGGIQQTMAELLTPPGNGAWVADGGSHEIRLGEGVVVIRIEDESGRIDLNRADLATLESMLVSTGLPTDEAQHLAAAIADYRDPDDIKTPGGAEAFDYEAAGLRHGPKNGPFDSPEEVMQVLGMTPAILRAILPLITVHSPSGEVNRQAASPAVRRALPKTEFGSANQPNPDPEGPAISIATVVRVTAEATTRNGGHFIREAILQRSTIPTQPFTILSWRRRWPG
jgi:general secretion pathway protein K